MNGHDGTLATILGVASLALFSCRSSGDFRLRYEPDPVPREARTGHAWFRARIDSLARRSARVGVDGPLLPPGQSIWIDVDLDPSQETLEVPIFDRTGRRLALLRAPVETRRTAIEAEQALPIPSIAGRAPRVLAGFHASNHRRVGRRQALDLTTPLGIDAFGARIESPVRGKVLGVTDDAPDRPGGRPNELLLLCDDGMILLFSHLQRGSIRWRPGDRVRRGETIGRIGLSGVTSGPHLHLELVREKATAAGARQ